MALAFVVLWRGGAVPVDRMDERPPQNVAHLFFGDAMV